MVVMNDCNRSCDHFICKTPYREGNNSWNFKDRQGAFLCAASFACLILIFVTIFKVVYRRYRHRRIIDSTIVAMLLVIISLALYIGVSILRDNMIVVYAASSVLTSFVRTPPVLQPYDVFSGSEEFEDNYIAIRDEINALDTQKMTLTKDTFEGVNENIGRNVKDNEGWRILPLCIGENISEAALHKLPTLVSLIKKYRNEIQSAAVSVIPPNTHIPQHVGYYKGIVRWMFAIKVPRDRSNCFLCVNNQRVLWQEGKSIAFDDCYPHKVFNDTEESRVVIYMDITRKNIGCLRKLNDVVIKTIQNSGVAKSEISKTEQILSNK